MSEGQSIERLRQTFGVVDNRTVTISVLAEENENDADAKKIVAFFEQLKAKYKGKISETRYFFGEPERKTEERETARAKARWVHDTDVAVTSDLLITSPSYYSALLAAMQRKKRAFTITEGREDFDLPGMIRGSQGRKKKTRNLVRITETAVLEPFSIE